MASTKQYPDGSDFSKIHELRSIVSDARSTVCSAGCAAAATLTTTVGMTTDYPQSQHFYILLSQSICISLIHLEDQEYLLMIYCRRFP